MDLNKLSDIAHLDDAKKEVESKANTQPQSAPQESAKNKYDNEYYTFQFEWQSPQGEKFEGAFTTKILSMKEQRLVGVLRAQLNGGLPSGTLDDLTEELNFIIARLSFCLTQKPQWANDLDAIKYPALLQAIFREVVAHENYFLGYRENQAKGQDS